MFKKLTLALLALAVISACATKPPVTGEGDACTSDSACGDGFTCQNGACINIGTIKPECTFHSDCEENELCENGSCVAMSDYECMSVDDCDDGEQCIDNKCVDPNDPDECEQDSDCDDDELCDNGECKDNGPIGPSTVYFSPLDKLSDITCGEEYDSDILVNGGSGNYTWTASGLPAGITLTDPNANPALFEGKITTCVPGNVNVAVNVCDKNDATNCASKTFSVTVKVKPISITTSECTFSVKDGGTCKLEATGGLSQGSVGGYNWTVTGLAKEIVFNGVNTLTAQPNALSAGTTTATVQACDKASGISNCSASKPLAIIVTDELMIIAKVTSNNGLITLNSYNNITADGGLFLYVVGSKKNITAETYSWSITDGSSSFELSAAQGNMSGLVPKENYDGSTIQKVTVKASYGSMTLERTFTYLTITLDLGKSLTVEAVNVINSSGATYDPVSFESFAAEQETMKIYLEDEFVPQSFLVTGTNKPITWKAASYVAGNGTMNKQAVIDCLKDDQKDYKKDCQFSNTTWEITQHGSNPKVATLSGKFAYDKMPSVTTNLNKYNWSGHEDGVTNGRLAKINISERVFIYAKDAQGREILKWFTVHVIRKPITEDTLQKLYVRVLNAHKDEDCGFFIEIWGKKLGEEDKEDVLLAVSMPFLMSTHTRTYSINTGKSYWLKSKIHGSDKAVTNDVKSLRLSNISRVSVVALHIDYDNWVDNSTFKTNRVILEGNYWFAYSSKQLKNDGVGAFVFQNGMEGYMLAAPPEGTAMDINDGTGHMTFDLNQEQQMNKYEEDTDGSNKTAGFYHINDNIISSLGLDKQSHPKAWMPICNAGDGTNDTKLFCDDEWLSSYAGGGGQSEPVPVEPCGWKTDPGPGKDGWHCDEAGLIFAAE